jgi:DNA-binding Lrp family transcriptional regulator
VNPFALPHTISALVGVNLKSRNYEETMREIEKIPEITSVWSATGRFDLFFEIMVDSLDSLYRILYRKEFREIESISYTETHVTLSSRTKFFKLS